MSSKKLDIGMGELRNIIYNCKQATYLIEKQQIGKITLREKVQLHIHLYGCSICKLFNKQSSMINAMIKQLLNNTHSPEIKLEEGFKNDLQNKIEEELNKN
ncbi:hypothetical protein GCM10027049_30170 [Mucilaginibacter puniceus]